MIWSTRLQVRRIVEGFRELAWVEILPEHLIYANAQILLIGEGMESMEKLEHEDELWVWHIHGLCHYEIVRSIDGTNHPQAMILYSTTLRWVRRIIHKSLLPGEIGCMLVGEAAAETRASRRYRHCFVASLLLAYYRQCSSFQKGLQMAYISLVPSSLLCIWRVWVLYGRRILVENLPWDEREVKVVSMWRGYVYILLNLNDIAPFTFAISWRELSHLSILYLSFCKMVREHKKWPGYGGALDAWRAIRALS